MKKKIIIIVAIAVGVLFLSGITYSKFTSSSELSVVDQYLAKFVFEAKMTDTIQLPLVSMTPGSEASYSFVVTNNKDEVRSNVTIDYQISLETFHFMPLSLQLYKVVDEQEELVMTCDESYSRNEQNHLVCNSATQRLTYQEDGEDQYVLKVQFPEEYNDVTYADLVDFIDIHIKSCQAV